MSGGPRCQQCGTEVLPTWDWCEGCGWDPNGMKPATWTPPPPMMRASAPPMGMRVGAVPPPPGDASFHVDVPGQPAIGTDDTGSPPPSYVAWPTRAHAQYAVTYASLPAGTQIDVQGALAGAINGMSQGGAHIKTTLDVPFQNNQARAFSGTADGGLPLKGLVFIRGTTIFVLAAEGPNAVGQADRFFDSFVLTS